MNEKFIIGANNTNILRMVVLPGILTKDIGGSSNTRPIIAQNVIAV